MKVLFELSDFQSFESLEKWNEWKTRKEISKIRWWFWENL